MISNTLALILNEMEEGIKVESVLHTGSQFSFKIFDKSPEDQITISSHRIPTIQFKEAKLFNKYRISPFEMEEGQSSNENTEINFFSTLNEKNSYKKNNSAPWTSQTSSSFFFISDLYSLCKKDLVRKIEKNNGFNFVIRNLTDERTISEKTNSKKLFTKNSKLSKNMGINKRKEQKDTLNSNRIKLSSLELIDTINIFEYNKEQIKILMSKKTCSCPTALIIDDNDFNILALSTQLERFNIKSSAALNGNEAMGKIIEIFGIGQKNGSREKSRVKRRRSLVPLSEQTKKQISKRFRARTTKFNKEIYRLKKRTTFIDENSGPFENSASKKENNRNSSCCNYFKVIFLDLEMPGKNGIETFENIKKFYEINKLLEKLNVIAVTAYERNSDIAKRILGKGVKELVTKPISMEVLVLSMEYSWLC